MKVKEFIKKLLHKNVYNPKWKCNVCGEEIFNGDYFCENCKNDLPRNDKSICNHCGRETEYSMEYCLTCKGNLTAIDKARSVYNYKEPIKSMIYRFKYDDCRYFAEIFGRDIALIYQRNYFASDYITYVPMTKKREKERGYNQSLLIAEELSKRIGVEIYHGIVKKKETPRQATLTKESRIKNLVDAFRVNQKKILEGKSIVIVDDVTTTGATAEAIASKLKKAGASEVNLITVASVSRLHLTAKS